MRVFLVAASVLLLVHHINAQIMVVRDSLSVDEKERQMLEKLLQDKHNDEVKEEEEKLHEMEVAKHAEKREKLIEQIERQLNKEKRESPPEVCEDTPDPTISVNCPIYKGRNMCGQENVDYYCPRTCGKCTPAAITTYPAKLPIGAITTYPAKTKPAPKRNKKKKNKKSKKKNKKNRRRRNRRKKGGRKGDFETEFEEFEE